MVVVVVLGVRGCGGGGGVLPGGLGSDLWSTVCVICGNVTDDWSPVVGDLLQDDE